MRRMLDPKEVGGGSLPSTITFDEEGNRKVGKNLGVDGKLTLNSLVSASNPDGDITKALGGAKPLYQHAIFISTDEADKLYIELNIYNYQKEKFTTATFKQFIKERVMVSGLFVKNSTTYLATMITKSNNETLTVNGIKIADITQGGEYTIPSRWYLFDRVQEVK